MCACACFSIEHLWVYTCVSVRVLPKSRNGRRHSSASLNHRHLDQNSGSMQMSCCSVTAWIRPLHFLAYCWSHLTPRWIQERHEEERFRLRNACIMHILVFGHVYTHPRAREISSSCILCSCCPFSAGFILYCWTSWATWFSWCGNKTSLAAGKKTPILHRAKFQNG